MKTKLIIPLALIILVSSCKTAYKNIQTPDDVYYSPAPAQKVYAQSETQNDYYNNDDNYLRMKAQNYNRWACIDDYSYWNDSRYFIYNQYYSFAPNPYTSGYCWGYGYSNPFDFNFYGSPWNSWNQPYCTVVYYKNPAVYYGSTSASNLSAYNNHSYSLNNIPLQKGLQNTYNNSNILRTNSNTNNSSNATKPVRLFSGSSSSAGGKSGGFKSSGSGGNTRPPKPPMQ